MTVLKVFYHLENWQKKMAQIPVILLKIIYQAIARISIRVYLILNMLCIYNWFKCLQFLIIIINVTGTLREIFRVLSLSQKMYNKIHLTRFLYRIATQILKVQITWTSRWLWTIWIAIIMNAVISFF